MPESKSFPIGKKVGDSEPPSSPKQLSGQSHYAGKTSGNLHENIALTSLRELIAAGNHRLDPLLGTIADAARQLTGASGAALAMWKEGAMVCRARSGDTAPSLGARLSANTGISGECLRTGKMQHCSDTENDPVVDVEVCRSLGLRSIAVLPIQGWRGVNGILEVFSAQPSAFTPSHIAFLEQLAALAERARATQPHEASTAAPKPASAIGKSPPSRLLPASDPVGDVALAFIGSGRRPRALVLGMLGFVAISLVGLVIWLGWRGADDTDAKSQAAAPASVDTATVNSTIAGPAVRPSPNQSAPDNDPVWKKNPGGESLYLSVGKPSAGSPVKFVSKLDVVADKNPSARGSLPGDSAEHSAPNPTVTHAALGAQWMGSDPDAMKSGKAASEQPPSIATLTPASPPSGILPPAAVLPFPSMPVSTGVSGGQLVRRVIPLYSDRARQKRQEGTVTLLATVIEDGTVGEIRIVDGPPELAQSAVDAVKQWRYKPYVLDGTPVKNEVRISFDFKLPGGNH